MKGNIKCVESVRYRELRMIVKLLMHSACTSSEHPSFSIKINALITLKPGCLSGNSAALLSEAGQGLL